MAVRADRIRAVLDTNVLVSAVLFGGRPRQLVDLAREDVYDAVCSLYILREFQRVLTRPKLGVEATIAETLALEVAQFSEVLPIDRATGTWSLDPDDDPIIETALSGRASHLVTGDTVLLHSIVPGLLVVTCVQALALLGAADPDGCG